MVAAPEILKERIQAKLLELNVTAREISMAAVRQPDAIRNILRKGLMPGIDRLDALATELEITSDRLLGRENAIERTIKAADGEPVRGETFRRLPRDLPIYGTALGADLEFDDDSGVSVTI